MHSTVPEDVIKLLNNPNIRSVIIDYGLSTLSDGTRGYSVNILTRGADDSARSKTLLEGPTQELYRSLERVIRAAGYTRKSEWSEDVRGSEGGADYFRAD